MVGQGRNPDRGDWWCMAMKAGRRVPWVADRADALRPVQAVLMVAFVGGLGFDAPLVTGASVGAFAGLIGYSYGCNLRSGRLRLFGLWPRR